MSVLNTGISGLLAAQRALSVVSHNIANVNTEGYTRQRAELSTRDPQPYGSGFVGTGVHVSAIQRVYDQFAVAQVRSASSGFSQAQQYQALAEQINNLLSASGVGILPALQDFFDAVQGVANDPSSHTARQVLISEANALAAQFQYFDQQIAAVRGNTNGMLATAVEEVNNLTAAIADVNGRIVDAGMGAVPNDLFDRRDELIRQLSERVSVTTVPQDNGSINVFIGNGQAVVAGSESRRLDVVPNAYDPERLEVAYVSGASPVVITNQLSGGRIGGILEFRSQILEPTRNALGQLAFGVAATFNAQHAMGMDLHGALGGDFFAPLNAAGPPATSAVLPHARNAGNPPAVLGVTVTGTGALTASDYRLDRNGSSYTLTRLSDNAVFALSGFPAGEASVDGMTVSLNGGAIADGDSFIISPARNAARNFAVAITDPARIAAAGPVRGSASLDNLGSGSIGLPAVVDLDAYTAQTYRIVAVDTGGDGVADAYTVLDADDVVVAGGPWTAGSDIEFGGIRVALSGTPRPGDVFVVEPNAGGVSDNRNALALAGLQTAQTMNNGSASYQALYGSLVGDVGNKTRQAQVNVTVQESIMNRATEAREAVSGVNLDEEAAAIMRFQQAYQASAQLISTANTIFETLISMLRR